MYLKTLATRTKKDLIKVQLNVANVERPNSNFEQTAVMLSGASHGTSSGSTVAMSGKYGRQNSKRVIKITVLLTRNILIALLRYCYRKDIYRSFNQD